MDTVPREIRKCIWVYATAGDPFALEEIALVCKSLAQDVKELKRDNDLLLAFLTQPKTLAKIYLSLMCSYPQESERECRIEFAHEDWEADMSLVLNEAEKMGADCKSIMWTLRPEKIMKGGYILGNICSNIPGRNEHVAVSYEDAKRKALSFLDLFYDRADTITFHASYAYDTKKTEFKTTILPRFLACSQLRWFACSRSSRDAFILKPGPQGPIPSDPHERKFRLAKLAYYYDRYVPRPARQQRQSPAGWTLTNCIIL